MQTPETTSEDDEIPTFDESGAAPDPFEDDEVCKLVFFVLYIHVYAISKMYFMHTLRHRSPLSG